MRTQIRLLPDVQSGLLLHCFMFEKKFENISADDKKQTTFLDTHWPRKKSASHLPFTKKMAIYQMLDENGKIRTANPFYIIKKEVNPAPPPLLIYLAKMGKFVQQIRTIPKKGSEPPPRQVPSYTWGKIRSIPRPHPPERQLHD